MYTDSGLYGCERQSTTSTYAVGSKAIERIGLIQSQISSLFIDFRLAALVLDLLLLLLLLLWGLTQL